jgi:hypothetical protein
MVKVGVDPSAQLRLLLGLAATLLALESLRHKDTARALELLELSVIGLTRLAKEVAHERA